MTVSGRSPTIQAACSHTAIIQPAAVMENYIPYKKQLQLIKSLNYFKNLNSNKESDKG